MCGDGMGDAETRSGNVLRMSRRWRMKGEIGGCEQSTVRREGSSILY